MNRIILSLILILSFSFTAFSQQNKSQMSKNSENQNQSKGTLKSEKRDESIDNEEYIDEPYKKFRFSIGGGYASRTGEKLKTDDTEFNKLNDDLSSGYNLEANAQYFFNKYLGVGLNFNMVRTSGKISTYKENNSFIFVGPTIIYHYDYKKWLFTSDLGFGPLFYTASYKLNSNASTGHLNMTTMGGVFGISGEYKIAENWGAGLRLSATGGSKKIGDYSDDRLSMSSYLITAFISFRTK